TIRKANRGKNMRITWHAGGNVEVGFIVKSKSKCQCSVQHDKFPDEAMIETLRAFWTDALTRLKQLLET
ncbi:MAG: hypothetical protein ABJA67_12650, partial [Chthonomonadales bacterium]